MTADILRKKFLDFFKARKHRIVESDSLVPAGDPTVLFTPAGMNQFKKQFLGINTGFTRAASSQRCLRTDDLDKVGLTSGHHTFFEMLGNFSFGDYFKKEAIAWAWEFLTEELKISREKLWVSVYKDDEEAFKIWKDSVKVPQDRIVKLGDKENFWPSEAKEKGPNGPCGPCSEIFYDFGRDVGCKEKGCDPSCDCGRFVEIWNLVFTQFNRKADGALEPLPKKNIDTGMGLERLTAVMQGARNNFETELFLPLIKEIKSEQKVAGQQKESLYAVSDHIRAITFAIYDGVLPSNEGRGYVVRKLIRKSVLHLKALGINKPFAYKLVPVLCDIMKAPYPELERRRENISEIILSEEKGFISTLASSEALFEEKFKGLSRSNDPEKAGAIVFQLYDTYGIPPELTKDWLGKNKIEFSIAAFNNQLNMQKSRSKSQSAMQGDVFSIKDVVRGIKETKFRGYKDTIAKAKILKIIKQDIEAKKIGAGDTAEIILDASPFYAESGGQVGDTGEIIRGKNIFEVLDTKKIDKVIVHAGRVKAGSFRKSDEVTAKINAGRRLSIARNHTATHLLQAALREVLGDHVRQQGSLVAEEKFRFDFTHFKDLSGEQLERVEEIVNGYILGNSPLKTEVMTQAAAKKTQALAFFGEKYEEKVRVVSIAGFSKEFCGGTHLDSTSQIGYFKIIHEGSVSSGVRRIEAVTGTFAQKLIREEENILSEAQDLLNVPRQRLVDELKAGLERIRSLEKQLEVRKLSGAREAAEGLLEKSESIGGIKLIAQVLQDMDLNLLRGNIDSLKAQAKENTVIALGSSAGGKAMLVIGVTADLCAKNIDASALIKEAAQFIGGSGGGRKDFAQAGGNDPENFQKAFAALKETLGRLK